MFHVCSWEELAWPSKRPLTGWFSDLEKRIQQLIDWVEDLRRPQSTWLPGKTKQQLKNVHQCILLSCFFSLTFLTYVFFRFFLFVALFNPMAFFTALMQVTGRKNNLPLDNMTIETHVTIYPSVAKLGEMGHPEDGAFCHGLFLEGMYIYVFKSFS